MIYRLDREHGKLVPNDPPFAKCEPGSGPRHFTFHPDGKHAYVIEEISCTVTAFDYDAATGALKSLQKISTLPKDFKGNEHLRRGPGAPLGPIPLRVQPRA